jgi:hypothetical protein
MGAIMNQNVKNIQELIDYIRGRLDPDKRAEVADRIGKDPVLQKLVTLLGDLRDDMRETDWPDMKSAAHALLSRQLKEKRGGRQKKGVTIFDSQLLPLPVGVRPALVDTRRIRYKIDETLLEVSVYPVSLNSFELIGQLTEAERRQSLTITMRFGRKKFATEANEFGLFRFPRLTKGKYIIAIRAGDDPVGELELEL